MEVFSGQNDLSIYSEIVNLNECKFQLCNMMLCSGFEKLYFIVLAWKFKMKKLFFSKFSHLPRQKRGKKGIKKISFFINSRISYNKKISLDKFEFSLLKMKNERRINFGCLERFLPEDKKKKFRRKIEGVFKMQNIFLKRWVSRKCLEKFFFKMKNM